MFLRDCTQKRSSSSIDSFPDHLLHYYFFPTLSLFKSLHEFADARSGPKDPCKGFALVPAGGWLPWLGPESKEALRLKLATPICDCWLGPLALFSEAQLKVERASGSKTWPRLARPALRSAPCTCLLQEWPSGGRRRVGVVR